MKSNLTDLDSSETLKSIADSINNTVIDTTNIVLNNTSINEHTNNTIIYIVIIIILLFLIVYFRMRKEQKGHIDPGKMKKWREERRKRGGPGKLDTVGMSDNIEKSHELWKKLSKIVHESKWINETSEKQEIAAKFNTLINEHKGNYKKLVELERLINKQLQ